MMKIKKYILALIVSLMLTSTSLVLSAQDGASLSATLNNNQLEVTFVLPKTEKGVDALAGTLDYDVNKLELVDVVSADSRLKEPLFNNENGKFTSLIKSKTIDDSINAIKFTFKLKSENVDGMTISINSIDLACEDDTKLSLDSASVTIRVKENKPTSPDKPSDTKKDDVINPPTTDKNDTVTSNKKYEVPVANNLSDEGSQSSSNDLWVTPDEISSAVKDNPVEEKNDVTVKDDIGSSNKITNSEQVETTSYWFLWVMVALVVVLLLLMLFILFRRDDSKER